MDIPNAEDAVYIDNLKKRAALSAKDIKRGGCRAAATPYIRHCKRMLKNLQEAAAAAKNSALPELEWLLDNRYIAERELKSAGSDLKAFQSLPEDENSKPLVVMAAGAYLEVCGLDVTARKLEIFLEAFQTERPLTEAELCAFIPALKLELIVKLCQNAETIKNAEVSDKKLTEEIGAVFTSLRLLSNFDSTPMLEQVSRTEQTLRRDPENVYGQMDETTRQVYRSEVSRLARKNNVSEHETAAFILELSKKAEKHVGFFIFKNPLGTESKKRTGSFYISFIILGSLFISLLTAFTAGSPAIAVLLFIPVTEIIKNVIDFAVARYMRPKRVPRLELSEGVPESAKTLCAVSVLLSSETAAVNAVKLLEEYMISNRDAGENLYMALLADLPESKTEKTEKDEKFIAGAKAQIEALNEKYGSGFFLFTRSRTLNKADKIYSGWERKRGAILELCRLLRGRRGTITLSAGEGACLAGVKYIIALDSDTRLSAGAARELIGAALHPLNRPEIDGKRKIVISGSAIIQPRVSVNLSSAMQSDFSMIFAGQGGIDPYGGTPADLYQNMFGTGGFTGKGIIDIDAYLECLDTRFPENKVLSHDLLEGAYLRCSFAGDIELTDGFPASAASYYSRSHRWIRGDWQTLPWLRKKTRDFEGNKIDNPLSQIDKWKIIDNARRSLVSPFIVLALMLGTLFSGRVFVTAFVIALCSIFMDLVISGAVSIFKVRRGRVRYISSIINGFGGQLVKTLVKFVLLPYDAYISVSAIGAALYRMCFSHRRMLEWVPAAESERRSKNTVFQSFKRMYINVVLAFVILLFSPYPPALALAVVWVFTPLYAFSLSRPKKVRTVISNLSRMFLSRCAGDIWRYFEDMVTAEDNYLPPDNYQEQPACGIAHRTSPTNIGLALLSAIAASDIGVCTREVALGVIEAMLESIKRLPKWRGHLYNWYDTVTLSVLRPAYVSTVDSGNFYGCMLAVREGLREWGECSLAEAADELLRPMSFAPLFDEARCLFCVGWDAETNLPGSSWYDLLSSEARLTSYIAIARGEVPRKHWRKLGRTLVSQDGYRGMVSWTGTMFEYLMPELLLPCFRDSLIYESLKFCVYVQKKGSKGRPWGESESAFYDFDHSLSYRYKAHGAERLALKRGMGRDTVISPYSSFLALQVDKKSSLYNLRRLERLGATGRYGFYEALDYTGHRLRGSEFEPVKTYFAHHLGMSILAIDNVLNNGIMQKRFMRDCEMSAFSELLQEKVPIGGWSLSESPREVPDKPLRAVSDVWQFESHAPDFTQPRCCLLSNGAYTVLLSETGQSNSTWNGITLTRSSFEQVSRDCGVAFFLMLGDELISLQPSPFFGSVTHYGAQLSGRAGKIRAKHGDISSVITVMVPGGDSGELRTVELSSLSDRTVRLVSYFEPVLARRRDYDAHPAFSKLSLETSLSDDTIVIKRRPRTKGQGVCLAFSCDRPVTFDTSRESSLGRGGILSLEHALQDELRGTMGAVLDPCVLTCCDLKLQAGETVRVSYAIAPSTDFAGAVDAASRILSLRVSEGTSRFEQTAARLGMTHEQVGFAMELLSEIVYPSEHRMVSEELRVALSGGQRQIWSIGVSGDLPIVTASVESAEDFPFADRLIKTHALLYENGMPFDLVFTVSDGGDYHSTQGRGIMNLISSNKLEGRINAKGGIHVAECRSPGAQSAVASAVCAFESGGKRVTAERNELRRPVSVQRYSTARDEPVEYVYNADGSFSFSGGMPHNAWSHLLANREFGYLATDSGTGHMWYKNARENKINRWENDSLSADGTEKLMVFEDGKRISLFKAPDGYDCRVTYGFGFARWEKTIEGGKITTTAFVPWGSACRVFIIDLPGEFEVSYFTDLVMAPDDALGVFVTTSYSEGVFSAYNSYRADFKDTMFHTTASTLPKSYTCSKQSYLMGEYDGKSGCGVVPCFAAVYPSSGRVVIVSGCESAELLRELANPGAALACLEKTLEYWRGITSTLTVKTPSDELNHYLNGWSVYQTYCCRVLARTSLYQSGGAFGFRDQLQDVCALIDILPDEVVGQMLNASEHQFIEGDVMHWWHPGTAVGEYADKGVRTKCSDDLLWLPYTLCEYVFCTGDVSVCEIEAGFVESRELSADESERYEQPKKSAVRDTLFKHAELALELVIKRGTGSHGLCLIGSGDWNDGMNLVGAEGYGQSVWLTWFAAIVSRRFSELCYMLGKEDTGRRFAAVSEEYRLSADSAWDGKWYLRGYFDDGSPLGSSSCEECRIDSIAQSFAVLANGDPSRIRSALTSATEILFDRDNRVVKLFDPPFSDGRMSPGYIKGYSRGFRENGGQYTHGAIWLALGLLRFGLTEPGWQMLSALLPGGRPNDVYKTEPYVLAADVYSNAGHIGRGGWTWYTGASGWFRRVALCDLLGLDLRGGVLRITPRLPNDWKSYGAVWKNRGKICEITVYADGRVDIMCDGKPVSDGSEVIVRELYEQ